MELFEVVVSRYAWLVFLVMTIRILRPDRRLRERLAADSSFAVADRAIRRKVFLWMSLPWIVMGVGQLIGRVPSIWHFFQPRDGNPWVLLFFASILVVWAVSAYWIYLRNGAAMIADHHLMVVHTLRGEVKLTEGRVKVLVGLALLGGIVAVAMMFTLDSPNAARVG